MKYKIVKQPDEMNCGVACLSMICAYYGMTNMSLAVIRNFAQTDRDGNSIYSLRIAAEKLHMDSEAYEAEKEDFTVVIDPPRKGIDKSVIDALNLAKPKKIVYLSCNPATLARDLGYLSENYDVNFVQPYDMFPQTKHVETLVCLCKQ